MITSAIATKYDEDDSDSGDDNDDDSRDVTRPSTVISDESMLIMGVGGGMQPDNT